MSSQQVHTATLQNIYQRSCKRHYTHPAKLTQDPSKHKASDIAALLKQQPDSLSPSVAKGETSYASNLDYAIPNSRCMAAEVAPIICSPAGWPKAIKVIALEKAKDFIVLTISPMRVAVRAAILRQPCK